MTISELNANVKKYTTGKIWYWYLPLWLLGLYMFVELLQFNMAKQQLPLIWVVPYSFNFMLHEWAHIFTAWLPPVLTASAGSGSELILGLALIIIAFWQRSYFASLFCFLWFNLACQSAGQYMADAVAQQLPLFSLGAALSGSEAKHDWHFVFGQLGLLNASSFIGDSVRIIGTLAGLCGVCFSAWVLYNMYRAPRWAASNNDTILAATYPVTFSKKTKPLTDDGFMSLPFDDDSQQSPPVNPPSHI